MKPRLKTFLLAILATGLIFGSLFVFRKAPSVASYSYYESLKIAPSSLNGNSVWGGGEDFSAVVSADGLDAWAAFYSASNKSSGGLDPTGALTINGVPYQMSWTGASDYTGNDTIRLYSGVTSATVTLDTIGAYEKLYVLGTAGGPGVGNYANFSVRVNYTDGTTDTTSYRLYDWYDSTPVDGVYKWGNLARRLVVKSGSTNTGWRPGQAASQVVQSDYDYEGDTSGAPYLQSATISVDSKKLVRSIDLVLTGKNGSSDVSGIYCGIYAITGMVNVSAPNPVEVIYVDGVTKTTADIHWDAVVGATGYRLDIALDPEFKNILPSYNNLSVGATDLTAEGLTPGTTYYTRVRAENSAGQSISSNVVGFTTDAEPVVPDEPEIPDVPGPVTPEIIVNTNGYEAGTWTNADVTLSIEDVVIADGETKYYSTDSVNWEVYEEPVVIGEDTLGTTYYFKAVAEEESEIESVIVKRDTVAPEIRLSDGSELDAEKTYYENLTLSVSDNVRVVEATVNGEAVDVPSGTLTLAGNRNATYVITAVDAAGNQTTQTIHTGALEISVTAETEQWIAFDVAGISATDLAGEGRIQVSTDNGVTWETLTTLDSTTYDVEANGNYIFRIVDSTNNSTSETVVYHNIDNVKPVVEVDSHGYTLGSWTNSPIALSARNVAPNLSPVTLYYREAGSESWSEYAEDIIILEDGEKTYEFRAVSATGLESDVVEAEVKKDAVNPTGEIATSENSWNSFLNRITFGLFFNETQTFTVSADDDRSGVAKVEYLLAENEIEDFSTVAWTEAESVSVDPEKDFLVYYRITDNAGNTTIINTDGIVLDTTAPTILGCADGETYPLENDKIYYLTQKLLVADNKSLEAVYLNGEQVALSNGIIEIPGNVVSTVEVVAVDSAGNSTSLVIKTNVIPSLDDLEHKTVDDEPTLDDLIEYLEDLLGENPTDSERELIEEAISDYEETKQVIEDTEEKVEIIEESYETVPDIDHVTSDDRETIEDLIEAIETVEAENGTHLTDAEREELDDMLDDLNEKLALLEEIKQELEDLDEHVNEFDLETVSKDDLAELEELREEIEELKPSGNLTDAEREHLDELLEQIDELEERIAEAEKALEEAKEKDTVPDVTPENVRPEDQTGLEDASQGYVEALGVFDGNFSLADLFDITNRISIINSALDVLDQVAEFENLVSRLPNPEDVNYDARTAIKAAQIAYNELSEYGRGLVGPSLLAKYRAVLEAYRAFLEGSPILYAFETLDVFWWAISTFFIVGAFIIVTHRTHRRYVEADEDKF